MAKGMHSKMIATGRVDPKADHSKNTMKATAAGTTHFSRSRALS